MCIRMDGPPAHPTFRLRNPSGRNDPLFTAACLDLHFRHASDVFGSEQTEAQRLSRIWALPCLSNRCKLAPPFAPNDTGPCSSWSSACWATNRFRDRVWTLATAGEGAP